MYEMMLLLVVVVVSWWVISSLGAWIGAAWLRRRSLRDREAGRGLEPGRRAL